MEDRDILKSFLEKGILLDKDMFNLFKEIEDKGEVETARRVIEKLVEYTRKRMITKSVLDENKEKVLEIIKNVESSEGLESKTKIIKRLKINLGISIEISKEVSKEELKALEEQKEDRERKEQSSIKDFDESQVKILSQDPLPGKTLAVADFVNYFRGRYSYMKGILQENPQLENLTSINKISGNRQGVSIIGMVLDKKITKNKNMLLEVEDLTGKMIVLINRNKEELYEKAETVALDSVIGIKGSGSREILFANDIYFPDSFLLERKKSPVEEYAVFTGDMHIGSKLFMEKNFERFIDYLNCKLPDTPEAEKIKYLFLIGDVVSGVGSFPGQEKSLKIMDLEEQFQKVAEYLGRIRKDINIIICSGNHDGVRLMEPQPIFDEKYAWPLYSLSNVTLVPNPSHINFGAKKNFSGFELLMYHGFSYHYYADNIGYLMKDKAIHTPEKVMAYLLKNRHLAPTHASTQYFPSKEDSHVIKKVPDIFFSGHTHKSAISYYNNILIISGSCWESKTPYQEKMGNEPDFCKVPLLNLKTRAIKILDFE